MREEHGGGREGGAGWGVRGWNGDWERGWAGGGGTTGDPCEWERDGEGHVGVDRGERVGEVDSDRGRAP